MEKLNIQKVIFALEEKANELEARATAIKADETLSKNTRQTRVYGFRKEMYLAKLMQNFLKELHRYEEEIEIEDDMASKLDSFTTLSADRVVRNKIVVNKGDTLMQLLQKYNGRKYILAKIQKAVEEAGLTLNSVTGIVE